MTEHTYSIDDDNTEHNQATHKHGYTEYEQHVQQAQFCNVNVTHCGDERNGKHTKNEKREKTNDFVE